MDRVYFQIIREANDIVPLAIAIARNADYKECIKAATDPIAVDILKELQHTQRTLREVIERQEMANS